MPFSLKLQPHEIPPVCRKLKLFELELTALTNTLDIAAEFGKRHRDIVRIVNRIKRAQPEFGERNFARTEYLNVQNKKLSAFNLTEEGFMFLVFGLTGEKAESKKIEYIEAYSAMKEVIRELSYEPPEEAEEINPRMTVLSGNSEPIRIEGKNRVYSAERLKNSPFVADRKLYKRMMELARQHKR